jgi:fumarylacetoacetase
MNFPMNFSLQSWVEVSPDSHFPIQNLPLGIFSTFKTPKARVGVAIGDYVLDVAVLSEKGFLKGLKIPASAFKQPFLNPLIALGKPTLRKLHQRLTELLEKGNAMLLPHQSDILVAMKDAVLHLPIQVGDYTDFYASKEHASHVGAMFRNPANPLPPNWLYLPIGYHGRASSIVVSGTDIYRPKGQIKVSEDAPPIFAPTQKLDFELEMGFVVGKNSELGQSISTHDAENYIYGMVLLNDWSARDIQRWEYQPLGPFLGKNFASSISPWVVSLEVLNEFQVETPPQEPEVLDYLKFEGKGNFDIQLEVSIQPYQSQEKIVCQSNTRYLYWNIYQQLAHHTVNGCNMRIGDICGSGTISGETSDTWGSLLELTWNGQNPIEMPNHSVRTFLEDGDTVIMRAFAEKNSVKIGFGEVRGMILSAR